MDKKILLITFLAALAAILTISAELLELDLLLYLAKPTTMLLIIGIVLLAKDPVSAVYRSAIIGGLLFSLAGDIFLMLPFDLFRVGLISFLIAHIIYIFAFVRGRSVRSGWLTLIPFAVYGLIIFMSLAAFLGALKIPVLVYIAVILIMGWQALERWRYYRDRAALLALVGAGLFILSDTLHAFNRFREPFEFARAYILSTYFTAQWFIAVSTHQQMK
ncbi:MAG: lysoplasmalogenase [Candidatus Neomarinimicrobiota bacterium]